MPDDPRTQLPLAVPRVPLRVAGLASFVAQLRADLGRTRRDDVEGRTRLSALARRQAEVVEGICRRAGVTVDALEARDRAALAFVYDVAANAGPEALARAERAPHARVSWVGGAPPTAATNPAGAPAAQSVAVAAVTSAAPGPMLPGLESTRPAVPTSRAGAGSLAHSGATAGAAALRGSGIVARADWLLDRFAALEPTAAIPAERAALDAAWETLRHEAERAAGAIERACARRNVGPEELPARSRRAFATLRLLADATQLQRYRTSVGEAAARFERQLLEAPWIVARTAPQRPRARVRFASTTGLWSVRREHGGDLSVLISDGFIGAPAALFDALARVALARLSGRTPPDAARTAVDAWVASPAFRPVADDHAFAGRDLHRPVGAHHDLAEAFERVNAAMFGGEMPRPRLQWSTRVTSHCFGTYRFERDLVTLSRTLDAPDVPAFVVDYVLYHELLHKKHGTGWAESRRKLHTPAFRAEERRYPDWAEAERVIAKLARRARAG